MKKRLIIFSCLILLFLQVDAQIGKSVGLRLGGNNEILYRVGQGYNMRGEGSLGTTIYKQKDSLVDFSINITASVQYIFELENDWNLYAGLGFGAGVCLNDIKNKLDFEELLFLKFFPLIGAEYNFTDSWTVFVDYKPSFVLKGLTDKKKYFELYSISLGIQYMF